MRQFSDLMHDVGRNSTCRLPSDLYPFHFDEEWLSLRMSCSLMQIEAQNWKDFSVAISQTPRDDAMRCSMPSEVKTPNDFLLLWKKTFLKIKQNFRGHQLRIVWWNPLACKRRWAPQMLNIHKCSKSQLIWDIIKSLFGGSVPSSHGVWKSQKKSHSTLRAKRATFTFWVDKRRRVHRAC